jgi:hypothetical protein
MSIVDSKSSFQASETSAEVRLRTHRSALPQPISTSPSFFSFLRRWYWCSALQLLLRESCSLAHRMGLALEVRSWERLGYGAQTPSLFDEPPT